MKKVRYRWLGLKNRRVSITRRVKNVFIRFEKNHPVTVKLFFETVQFMLHPWDRIVRPILKIACNLIFHIIELSRPSNRSPQFTSFYQRDSDHLQAGPHMIVSYSRDKTVHAIAFFVENTAWFGKTKLYKLLYILDFEHFRQTGRSVTGFDYSAWLMGPVPTNLDKAINDRSEALTQYFDIEVQRHGWRRSKTFHLHPKMDFDPQYFSRREFALLKDVADRFAEATSDEMVWFTHRETEPWHRVWNVEKRKRQLIPYEYILADLDEEQRSVILDVQNERESFIANYS